MKSHLAFNTRELGRLLPLIAGQHGDGGRPSKTYMGIFEIMSGWLKQAVGEW